MSVSTEPEGQPKSRKWLIIAIVVVVVCCLCALCSTAGYYFYTSGDQLFSLGARLVGAVL